MKRKSRWLSERGTRAHKLSATEPIKTKQKQTKEFFQQPKRSGFHCQLTIDRIVHNVHVHFKFMLMWRHMLFHSLVAPSATEKSLSLLVFLFSFHFPIIFRSFYFHRRLAGLMRFLVAKFNHMNVMLILFFGSIVPCVCLKESIMWKRKKNRRVKAFNRNRFFSLSLFLSTSYLQPKALNLFLCHVNSSTVQYYFNYYECPSNERSQRKTVSMFSIRITRYIRCVRSCVNGRLRK